MNPAPLINEFVKNELSAIEKAKSFVTQGQNILDAIGLIYVKIEQMRIRSASEEARLRLLEKARSIHAAALLDFNELEMKMSALQQNAVRKLDSIMENDYRGTSGYRQLLRSQTCLHDLQTKEAQAQRLLLDARALVEPEEAAAAPAAAAEAAEIEREEEAERAIEASRKLAETAKRLAALNRPFNNLLWMWLNRNKEQLDKREKLQQIAATAASIADEADAVQKEIYSIQDEQIRALQRQKPKKDRPKKDIITYLDLHKFYGELRLAVHDQNDIECQIVAGFHQLADVTAMIALAVMRRDSAGEQLKALGVGEAAAASVDYASGSDLGAGGGGVGTDSGASLHVTPDNNPVSIGLNTGSSSASKVASLNSETEQEGTNSSLNKVLKFLEACLEFISLMYPGSSMGKELVALIDSITTDSDNSSTTTLGLCVGSACGGQMEDLLAFIANDTGSTGALAIPESNIRGDLSWHEARASSPDVSYTPLNDVNSTGACTLSLGIGQGSQIIMGDYVPANAIAPAVCG